MTALQEKAINLVKNSNDDILMYVIDFLSGNTSKKELKKTKALEALKNLEAYRENLDADIDYDTELLAALEDKYGNLH